MPFTNVTDETALERSIRTGKAPTVVLFFSEECGPCLRYAPILAQMDEECGRNLDIRSVDVGTCSRDFLGTYDVRHIPTIIVFSEGRVVRMDLDRIPPTSLRNEIESIIRIINGPKKKTKKLWGFPWKLRKARK